MLSFHDRLASKFLSNHCIQVRVKEEAREATPEASRQHVSSHSSRHHNKVSKPRSHHHHPSNSGNYYIGITSLTLENVLISVQTGLWATTLRNEESFSNAFRTASSQGGKVVLLFAGVSFPFVAVCLLSPIVQSQVFYIGLYQENSEFEM